jgi:hypothetical protein
VAKGAAFDYRLGAKKTLDLGRELRERVFAG